MADAPVSCLPDNPFNVVQLARMAIIVSWREGDRLVGYASKKRARVGNVRKRRAAEVVCVAVESRVLVGEP